MDDLPQPPPRRPEADAPSDAPRVFMHPSVPPPAADAPLLPGSIYRHIIRGKKKGHPPEGALEETASRTGRLRCQYWEWRDAIFWQCRRTARANYRVCRSHGAGMATAESRRIAEGRGPAPSAREAMLAPPQYRTGDFRDPRVERLMNAHPQIAHLYEEEVSDPNLYDFRKEVGANKAVLWYYIEQAMKEAKRIEDAVEVNTFELRQVILTQCREKVPDVSAIMENARRAVYAEQSVLYGPRGTEPALLRVISATEKLKNIIERVVESEERLGVLTHSDLDRVINVFAAAFQHYIPVEHHTEARAAIREQLADILGRRIQRAG